MARVQKRTRADGRAVYVVKWRTPDGTDRSKSGFSTRKAANAYGTKAENASLTGQVFDPNAGKTLFRNAAQEWLGSRADLKPTTLAGYRAALAPAGQRRGDGKTLGIDAVFGGYPLNRITRTYIQAWVQKMIDAGKKPSTVRHAYFIVHIVLEQATVDNKIAANPADHVKLPGERSSQGGKSGVVDDPGQFLIATQVSALIAATPWPYNVYVHLGAWAGLRAAELCGLKVGDVGLPLKSLNPNARSAPGIVRVERSARPVGADVEYMATKTDGSRRRVPLPAHTTELLRDYLALHPRGEDAEAPLFPGMVLGRFRPTGVRATAATGELASRDPRDVARRQADALAGLSVDAAEARLQLNWKEPLRHMTFYKAVFRPAVLRANLLTPTAKLSPELKFHSLRHTYASLCVAAGLELVEVSRFMGHAKPTTTLDIYTHLFNTDDHASAMNKLGGLSASVPHGGNVIPIHG